jgi:hypothetical protein
VDATSMRIYIPFLTKRIFFFVDLSYGSDLHCTANRRGIMKGEKLYQRVLHTSTNLTWNCLLSLFCDVMSVTYRTLIKGPGFEFARVNTVSWTANHREERLGSKVFARNLTMNQSTLWEADSHSASQEIFSHHRTRMFNSVFTRTPL